MTKGRHVPLRSCIACGLKVPKGELVRIVNTEQSHVIVDTIGKKPGRGAYICQDPDCWGRLFDREILDRSFKQRLSAEDLEPVRTYYQKNIASRITGPNL